MVYSCSPLPEQLFVITGIRNIALCRSEQTVLLEQNHIVLILAADRAILWKACEESIDFFNIPFDLDRIIKKLGSKLTEDITIDRDSINWRISSSIRKETLNDCLEDILRDAYGGADHGKMNRRYLFIESDDISVDERPFYFNSLLNALQSLNMVKIFSPKEDETKWIEKIRKLNESRLDITAKKFRDVIERSCFQSGAEEIQELLFGNLKITDELCELVQSLTQNRKRQVNTVNCEPALRMLLGAFAAGDIRIEGQDVIETTKKILIRNGISLDNAEIENIIERLAEQVRYVTRTRNGLRLIKYNLNPLWMYLIGRNILLIEDKLSTENWKIVIPLLFGLESTDFVIDEEAIQRNINGVTVTHKLNAKDGQSHLENESDDFDIILLDLYSSHDRQSIETLPTVKNDIRKLAQYISAFYKNPTKKAPADFVATSIPQVVVFSREVQGITVRSMIVGLDVADYFFKDAGGEAHKSAYYSTFRNSLINALKRNVTNVLNLSCSSINNKFNDWLSQFHSSDRAPILKIMKHFRYYSATNIIDIVNLYLDDTFQNVVKEKEAAKADVWISYLGRINKSAPATLALFSKTKWAQKVKPKFKDYHELAGELIERIKGPSDFRVGEFEGDYTIEALCDKLRADKFIPAENTIRGLNKLLEQCDLYLDLKNKMTPSSQRKIKDFEKLYEKERSHDDLKRLNRSALEECYPREIPKSQKREWEESRKKRLHVFLVDDMCMTGGQFESYIWKFINREVRRELEGYDVKKFVEFFKDRIMIHAIFAIGAKNDDIERILSDIQTGRVNMSLSGNYDVSLCSDKEHDTFENCKCGNDRSRKDHRINCEVHIADYTRSLKEICEKEIGLSFTDAKDMLGRYRFITNPPLTKDYPCDFEPLGWKETGALVATYANTAGNTIPIVWGDRDWQPLFNRFFNPLSPGSGDVSRDCQDYTSGCKFDNAYGKPETDFNPDKPCKRIK